MARATGSEVIPFIPKRGKRGPIPRSIDPRERRRRIKIVWMYVVDGWASKVVAAAHQINPQTVLNYLHDVVTYPEPEAAFIRSVLKAAQGEQASECGSRAS